MHTKTSCEHFKKNSHKKHAPDRVTLAHIGEQTRFLGRCPFSPSLFRENKWVLLLSLPHPLHLYGCAPVSPRSFGWCLLPHVQFRNTIEFYLIVGTPAPPSGDRGSHHHPKRRKGTQHRPQGRGEKATPATREREKATPPKSKAAPPKRGRAA